MKLPIPSVACNQPYTHTVEGRVSNGGGIIGYYLSKADADNVAAWLMANDEGADVHVVSAATSDNNRKLSWDLRVKRWKKMWGEFTRLNSFMFTPRHISANWAMASTTGTMGRAYKYAEYKDTHIEVDHKTGATREYAVSRFMRDDNGDLIQIKRDGVDAVIDFVSYYVSLYYDNVFNVERCNHPHASVRLEWDGDSDVGYCSQLRCSKCGGYLNNETEVDRYLPEDMRQPNAIERDPRPHEVYEFDECEACEEIVYDDHRFDYAD